MRRVMELRTISGKGGGPEKTLLNGPRFLRDAYETRLVYIRPRHDPDYDMPERARHSGVELADIPERGPIDLQTVVRLAREIRTFRPDVLHAHDYKTNALAVVFGRKYGIPAMTTLHGYVVRSGRLSLYYQLDRWSLRRMDHVIAVSEDLDRILSRLGIDRSRCSLIENAIDTVQYARRRSVREAKEQLGLGGGRLLVGAVGRLSAEKGFDVLIRAAGHLLRTGHDFSLIIVGEGDQRTRLEELIAALGCGDRIRLLGHRTDTLDLYEAMDVYALSSLREALPNVLLEAMAMEVPVVATRVAGVPRVITPEEDGLLVEPESQEALADALVRLLSDASLRTRFAREGRATVESRFSFNVRMQKVRGIYDALIDHRLSLAPRKGLPA